MTKNRNRLKSLLSNVHSRTLNSIDLTEKKQKPKLNSVRFE